MTIEKAQKDFDKLIEENQFTFTGTCTLLGNLIYHREWKKQVKVAWYGEMEDRLEVRIMMSYGYPLVVVKRNGREDPKFIRDYSSPKRAMNAIREIVRCAGFDWYGGGQHVGRRYHPHRRQGIPILG